MVVWIAFNLLVLEAATRAFFAAQTGPRVLLYGTSWHHNSVPPPPVTAANDPFARSVQSHHNDVGNAHPYTADASGYSKYFPNEAKWTESPDRKIQYPVHINNQGFRGPDFTVEKAPGTIRVLTLGASSTFGYHDRDDETYPVYLQQELDRAAGGTKHFEVINFAIPHADTNNVLSMLEAEGFALSPDVLTFYEGANDGAVIEPRNGVPAPTWRETLVQWSLLAALIDRFVPRSEAADVGWWWSDELAERNSKRFLANLGTIATECKRRGIRFVVATQQFQSLLIPPEQRHGLTYDQEVAIVREKVARGEIGPQASTFTDLAFQQRMIGADQFSARSFATIDPPRVMLTHARLMNDLRAWAPREGVALVDTIHELDGDRDLLVNWVHLRPEANRKIARALAGAILTELARPQAG